MEEPDPQLHAQLVRSPSPLSEGSSLALDTFQQSLLLYTSINGNSIIRGFCFLLCQQNNKFLINLFKLTTVQQMQLGVQVSSLHTEPPLPAPHTGSQALLTCCVSAKPQFSILRKIYIKPFPFALLKRPQNHILCPAGGGAQ